MATYQVDTDSGTYEVDTEDNSGSTLDNIGNEAGRGSIQGIGGALQGVQNLTTSAVKNSPALNLLRILAMKGAGATNNPDLIKGALAASQYTPAPIVGNAGKAISNLGEQMYPTNQFSQSIPGKVVNSLAQFPAGLASIEAMGGGVPGMMLSSMGQANPDDITGQAKQGLVGGLQGLAFGKMAPWSTVPRVVGGAAVMAAPGAISDVAQGKPLSEVGSNAAASGVTGALLSGLPQTSKEFGQDTHPGNVDQARQAIDAHRALLNVGKGDINKIEVKQGKNIDNYARIAAQEQLPYETMDENGSRKTDTTKAREIVQERLDNLETELDTRLSQDQTKKFSLENLRKQAKTTVTDAFDNKSGVQLQDALDNVDRFIDGEKDKFGRDKLTALEFNKVKRGMWSEGYDVNNKTSAPVARQIGHSIKESLNMAYPSQEINSLNKMSGDYITLKTLLEHAHGKVVKGGKLGKYFASTTGAIAGSHIPVIGPIIGHVIGGKVGDYIGSPERNSAQANKKAQAAGMTPNKIPGTILRGQQAPPNVNPTVWAKATQAVRNAWLQRNPLTQSLTYEPTAGNEPVKSDPNAPLTYEPTTQDPNAGLPTVGQGESLPQSQPPTGPARYVLEAQAPDVGDGLPVNQERYTPTAVEKRKSVGVLLNQSGGRV